VTRFIATLAVSFAAAGCTPDVASTGTSAAGGASGSSASSDSGSSGAGETTTGASGSTSGPTSASSDAASSGASTTTGGASVFPPCGNFTDSFDSVDVGLWSITGGTSANGQLTLTIQNGAYAEMVSKVAAVNWYDCVVSLELGASNDTAVTTGVWVGQGTTNHGIRWDVGTSHVFVEIGSTMSSSAALGEPPTALAVVLSGGDLYFLYRVKTTWYPLGTELQPAFLEDAAKNYMGFDLAGAQSNTFAYASFNESMITPQEL
jgi:hypothetical protein